MLKATAHTKLLNFASNAGALLAFALVATPWWAMGVAQIAGPRVGSASAQKQGARVIKPLLVLTTMTLAGKLIFDMI